MRAAEQLAARIFADSDELIVDVKNSAVRIRDRNHAELIESRCESPSAPSGVQHVGGERISLASESGWSIGR